MYTVTADGTFFTEQVRVGDSLIAQSDAPTALSDWTTIQNNIDVATDTVKGIANFPTSGGLVVSTGAVSIATQTSKVVRMDQLHKVYQLLLTRMVLLLECQLKVLQLQHHSNRFLYGS